MFTRNFINRSNNRFFNNFIHTQLRDLHIRHNKSLLKIYKSEENFSRFVRLSSSRTSHRNRIPIIAGIFAIGGAAVIYNVYKRKSITIKDTETSFNFDHEHWEEDIAMLSSYGPVPYLLIGAGCTSYNAFKAIRSQDPSAKVLVIGDEPHFPYMRPPLSKELWCDEKSDTKNMSFSQSDGKNQSIFFEDEAFYLSVRELIESKEGGIAIIRGKKVVKIDPVSQTAFFDKGEKVKYKKCLIATGSKPKNLPVFEKADETVKKNITVFRTVQDFHKLEKICKKIRSVVVVGGGFLGSELACSLAKKGMDTGLKVTQLFPESGVLGKVLPEYLSDWTTKKIINDGVKVIQEVEIQSVSKEGNEVVLQLNNDQIIKCNHVIVAVGADPNIDLAKTSNLEVDSQIGGFLVNSELEARKNLFVAGDASSFYDVNLGRRRVEHHDHAIVSGSLAGRNMAGDNKPYWHQPMFWSDLGPNIGFEAVGIIDSTLPTIGVFSKSDRHTIKEINSMNKHQYNTVLRAPNSSDNFEKGILFYLRDDAIVGIILWNLFGKIQDARQVISASKSSNDISDIIKLFDINSE